ncbi:hypothetical protein SAY87_012348 [Trapa incisa]|uniref:LIM zinc-binding domain-containing protein n=1 Tax=Trapa incisa TaxID=236973 RepID=A0AAN7GHB1_9MYRT|nr:hypothetical protein SAY87_012348 [Trapa incisa]
MPYGSTEKCKACEKTVYMAELVSADGVSYHKTCFRCNHCNGLLAASNCYKLDGALYCKTHFEQLVKEQGVTSTGSSKKQSGPTRTPNKFSHLFSGTQDKCTLCNKTAYPLEKLTVEGASYHKSCFRCSHGGCFLTPSSYAALDGILYCKPHFSQLFKEKGSYNLKKSSSMKKSAEEAEAIVDLPPEPEVETEQDPQ